MRWVRLLRPSSGLQWLLLVGGGGFALLLVSFVLTGQTGLQELRASGSDQSLPILQVMDRNSSGEPTSVLVRFSAPTADAAGRYRLDGTAGSIRGDNVLVRTNGRIIMPLYAYEHASNTTTILISLAPLLLTLLVVVGVNLREQLRPTHAWSWADLNPPR